MEINKQEIYPGKEAITTKYANIEEILNSLRDADPRNAAEYAYVLAVLYKQDGKNEQAIRFGRESISLLNKCPMETLEDCCSRNDVIVGIGMPSYFHKDIVRNNLKPLEL